MSKYLSTHRKKTDFGKKHNYQRSEEEDMDNVMRQMVTRIFAGKTEIAM